MSNDIGNRDFEEIIRQKLDSHAVPVPGGWEIIKKSLTKRRRRRRMYFIAVSSVAAAAVFFAAVVELPRAPKNPDLPPIVKVEDRPETDLLPKTPPIDDKARRNIDVPLRAGTQTTVDAGDEKRPDAELQATVLALNRDDNGKLAATAKAAAAVLPSTVSDTPPLIRKGSVRIAAELPMLKMLGTYESDSDRYSGKLKPGAAQGTAQSVAQSVAQGTAQGDAAQTKISAAKRLPETRSNGWIASFTVGAENSQAVNSGNTQIVAADPILGLDENSKEYIKNTYKNEMMIPDNVAPDFSLPLSAKLSVRKSLSRKWAVESGVNYTFLSSKYQWNRNTVKQRMHYLGIPLNAVYYAVASPQWNIYVSAGGTVEKCLHASLSSSERTTQIDVRKLQWSVNAAIGATYKIARNVGVFMEPQIGYFFDNEQPENIRTAWPVAIGFGAGLRVSL
ncbi:MAG: PorT family protein [Prevotellaceae bacterium]|jgi:hypothetical protein|nr:PorT family protein [Prevotellaceae bacterium]